MKRSEQVEAISKALAAAQAEMRNPAFDSSNPHFRNKFASLAAIRNAVVPVFSKHGLSVMQELTTDELGVSCTTIIQHESGQWLEFGPLTMPANKPDAQGLGSAATYCRRYALQAVVAVVGDEDDDAEAAQGRKPLTVDPRGELGKSIDPAKRDAVIQSFRAAFDLDAEEKDIAFAVVAVHERVSQDHDLYIAAADGMTAKERSAIKKYIQIAKEQARAEPKL